MKNSIQSLREYQNQVDLSKLEKSIYISIDRLTVIFDSENQSLRRIFRELRKSLDNIIQEFSIQENLREDYFTLYKTINEDSINLIFFQLSDYGGYQVIRLDFNPNSLKEFEGLQVWRQIMNYARLNRLEIRLSRLDLAFDIFNRPEIVFLQHIKRADKLNIESKPFWWRLEFQLRTKAINEETISEISKRLENFSFFSLSSVPDDSKAFAYIFLHEPALLPELFPYLKPNTIRVKKTRLRKHLKAFDSSSFSLELQDALKEQTPRLNNELKQLIGEFLELTSKGEIDL